MKNSQTHFGNRKWIECPHCGKKLAMVEEQYKVEKIFIKCTRCKNEIEIKNK